jgi:hypothetical protein
MPTPHVLAELSHFRQTDWAKSLGDPLRGDTHILPPDIEEPRDQDRPPRLIGRRHIQPQLKAAPNGAIQQFSVVGRSNRNHIARQLVDLHEQEGDHTLYFTGLVNVAALLTHRVEFVKEQDAGSRAGVLKQLSQPGICLTKVGAH